MSLLFFMWLIWQKVWNFTLTRLDLKKPTGEITILRPLPATTPGSIYAKEDKDHQAHGCGLALTETYLHYIKNYNQKVFQLNFHPLIFIMLMKCRFWILIDTY